MKKIITLLLITILSMGAVGCSEEETTNSMPSTSRPRSEIIYEETQLLDFDKAQKLGDIEYFVPEEWESSAITTIDGFYYYLDESKEDFIYLTYASKYNTGGIDTTIEENASLMLDDIIESYKSEGDKVSKTAYAEIAGHHGMYYEKIQDFNGINRSLYGYMTIINGGLYNIVAGYVDATKSTLTRQNVEKLLQTIQVEASQVESSQVESYNSIPLTENIFS